VTGNQRIPSVRPEATSGLYPSGESGQADPRSSRPNRIPGKCAAVTGTSGPSISRARASRVRWASVRVDVDLSGSGYWSVERARRSSGSSAFARPPPNARCADGLFSRALRRQRTATRAAFVVRRRPARPTKTGRQTRRGNRTAAPGSCRDRGSTRPGPGSLRGFRCGFSVSSVGGDRCHVRCAGDLLAG
jgi:hypothetical protein